MSEPLNTTIDYATAANDICSLMSGLYPLCRSITGGGVRETLRRLQDSIPLEIVETPSGTSVFDWTVPPEWNIRDAYIADANGNRIVDFHKHNLHVLSYSIPVSRHMTLGELRPHLHTLPERPGAIPYRTSYFQEAWGFCLSQRAFDALEDTEYEVCIDTSLEPGSLTYGEAYIPGASDREILISAHICHPSLANDNLSGIAIAAHLASKLAASSPRYSYRFVFAPGTIGAITWLARNEEHAAKIHAGLVLACLGDPGASTYKRSRQGNAEIDHAAEHVLTHSRAPFDIRDFTPYGYDERQYCSPGFNLPVGCLMRTPPGEFPEYHTSADNMEFIRPESLADSLEKLVEILAVMEGNQTCRNLNPHCEPQLGKRGLYGAIGGLPNRRELEHALLWVLNGSDGSQSLLDIARKAGLPFAAIRQAADALLEARLLD